MYPRWIVIHGLLGGLLALSACSIDPGARAPAHAPRDPLSAPARTGNRPAEVWVFDAEECLGCELTEPAQSVRLLQRRLGDRMETAVVALSELGEEDRTMVERFLESQRVSAHVSVRTPVEYSRDFGGGPVPAFYIVGKDRVVQIILDPDRADSRRFSHDSLSLADFVETLAEEERAPKENTARQ